MQHAQLGDGSDRFDRRTFCKAAGVVTAVGLVEASLGTERSKRWSEAIRRRDCANKGSV
jgi:hypothetical protein